MAVQHDIGFVDLVDLLDLVEADMQKVANGANAIHKICQTVWKFVNITTTKQWGYMCFFRKFQNIHNKKSLLCNNIAVKIMTKQRELSFDFNQMYQYVKAF